MAFTPRRESCSTTPAARTLARGLAGQVDVDGDLDGAPIGGDRLQERAGGLAHLLDGGQEVLVDGAERAVSGRNVLGLWHGGEQQDLTSPAADWRGRGERGQVGRFGHRVTVEERVLHQRLVV